MVLPHSSINRIEFYRLSNLWRVVLFNKNSECQKQFICCGSERNLYDTCSTTIYISWSSLILTNNSAKVFYCVIAPSAPPTVLSVDLVTATSFLVKWTLPPLNETNGRIRYFMLAITENETLVTTYVEVYHTTKLLEGLHPFYTYMLEVAAVTSALGPYSSPFATITKEAGEQMSDGKSYIVGVCNI